MDFRAIIARRGARFFARLAFAAWIPTALAVATVLMVGHWYTLPQPDKEDPVLHEALEALRSPGAESRWLAVHVLYAKCRCSGRVLESVFERGPRSEVDEKVLLVDHHEEFEARAAAAGFDVKVITAAQLKQIYHVESAPLLLVVDPTGELRYSGGYTERKQGYDIRDVEIVDELMEAGVATELPLFGCGVSKRLQDILDPIGVKY